MSLSEFMRYADHARNKIPRGKVDWSDSPLAWIRHHGPRTKNKLARDIVEGWLSGRGFSYRESRDGVSHFLLNGGSRTIVLLGVLNKEGVLEFAQLRAPGKGVDAMLLLGVEPKRVRIWGARPQTVTHLPTYGTDAPGLHHCSFDPSDPPSWLQELARWEDDPPAGGNDQPSLFD